MTTIEAQAVARWLIPLLFVIATCVFVLFRSRRVDRAMDKLVKKLRVRAK